ncbi:MAG: hypothetical protein MUF78_10515 [Candidatus Edwardsbacteria bacterium]|jgi:hypothetical protein|nr:hypothetical protein [Candidatus Edwardsbacteria bacterium]
MRIVTPIALAAALALCGCGKKDPAGAGTTVPAHDLIIDHACTDLARVPAQWIAAARSGLRLTYGHTSHGSQVPTGMDVLADSLTGFQFANDHYYYQSGNGSPVPSGTLSLWDGVPGGDLGNPDRVTWAGLTDTMLANADGAYAVFPHGRNVVLWSWCGQVSSATAGDIETYLSLMRDLEQSYPNVTFVYMTGHLDGSGASGNLNQRNEQIRAYCRANNKVLFDFADIESYDPDGLVNYMPLGCDDGCNYDSNGTTVNWAVSWITRNPTHELTRLANACGTCQHSERMNCIMKGRAFWWMMARLEGWDGN